MTSSPPNFEGSLLIDEMSAGQIAAKEASKAAQKEKELAAFAKKQAQRDKVWQQVQRCRGTVFHRRTLARRAQRTRANRTKLLPRSVHAWIRESPSRAP